MGEVVGRTYGGGTPSTSVEEFWNGDIPWIQSSNLTEGELFHLVIQKHISKDAISSSAAQVVPSESIAVVTHVGVGKLAYLGFPYATSQDFISLSGLKAAPEYTCYALAEKLRKDFQVVQGSAIKGITKDDLLGKDIFVPSQREQELIGSFFRNLDSLITLHQRK